ncbi:hypothetical protein Mapa_014308 [Marchantia paleacea]|nr:hypothetical protein Mapa_014308 [Marchantia paleacea]
MKWKAEADCVLGITFGTGRRKIGVGFGLQSRRVIRTIGSNLKEDLTRRCVFYCLRRSEACVWNWSLVNRYRLSGLVDPKEGMKRANVINLLLNMMPTPQQPAPSPPDHWSFLDQVDAPQWVDLAKEAALMGTLGDDPWFYRSHAHHETSLARVGTTALAIQSTSLREKVRPPTTKKKSTGVTKSKPSVKACLGGMKRISIAGLKEDRLSNRPRLGASQAWPRTPGKRIHVKGTAPRGRVAVPGSDARLAVYEPATTPRKKMLQGKLADPSVNGLRPPPAFARTGRASRGSSDPSVGGNGRSSQGSDPSVSGTDRVSGGSDPTVSDPSLSDQSLSIYDSPKPTLESLNGNYRNASVMSSSDMTCSSTEPSPTPSNSSAEGGAPLRGASLPFGTKSQLSRNLNSESFCTGVQPQESATKECDATCASANGGAVLDVKEPLQDLTERLELEVKRPKSVKVVDRDLPNGDAQQNGKSFPDLTQQSSTPTSTPSSTPRLKRKSLGPPLRVKHDGSGPPSSKKNGYSNSVLNQEVVLSDKLYGSQATHPILEKLRRSWGSALRVKQRKEAEANGGSHKSERSDSTCQNSSAFSGDLESTGASGARSDSVTFEEEATVIEASPVDDSGSRNLAVQSDDNTKEQSRVEIIVDSAREETQCSGGQVLVDEISPRSEASSTVQVTKTSKASAVAPSTGGKLSKSKSLGCMETRDRASSTPAKSGLAQQQKSKSDALSKTKKPSVNKDTLGRTSLPKKGNKENLSLELSDKSLTTSLDTDRKKKVPNPLLRTSTPTSTRPQASGNSTVSQPLNFTRTSPQARTTSAAHGNKTGVGSRSRSLPSSVRDTETTSGKNSEALDRKVSNLAVLRGSTSSVPTITKQKSDKYAQAPGKEVPSKEKDCNTAAVLPRAGKSSSVSSAPDEPSGYSTENDRKSRLVPKYEPRLHPVKVIREWESKSGKRYYDLQPGERQKVNQEITASKEMAVSKRGSA